MVLRTTTHRRITATGWENGKSQLPRNKEAQVARRPGLMALPVIPAATASREFFDELDFLGKRKGRRRSKWEL